MQALILAGGEGTRLRPLTSSVPKPVVTLVDRPFIAYMLEWLASHGVDDVIMSCGFLASGVRDVLGEGEDYGMRIRYVEEPTPMGTGGALKYAEEFLQDRFLMLNGDVLTDIDLTAQIAQHQATGAVGTLALVPVEDPSNYGLVRIDSDNSVTEFIEKPGPDAAVDINTISAGAYVLERSVLDLLEPGQPASIERDVFPKLVGNGLYAKVANAAYWMDIGTPERYLQGSFDILEGSVSTRVSERLNGSNTYVADGVVNAGRIVGPAIIESGCHIGEDAQVGGRAVLAQGVTVGSGSIVERSIVLEGATVGANCVLRGCIIGNNVQIGDGTTVDGLSVLGDGVTIGAQNTISNGARIFPGVELGDGAVQF
jgi:mannose-1-phosphate guanylyltransferase